MVEMEFHMKSAGWLILSCLFSISAHAGDITNWSSKTICRLVEEQGMNFWMFPCRYLEVISMNKSSYSA